MTKILILGGGFAGLETWKQIHKQMHPFENNNIDIEIINRDNYLTFTPMLHEAATGSVAREHVVQPIREITNCCGNNFHQAEIQKVDPKAKIVRTSEGDYPYDKLIVALGVKQGFFGTPGAAEHAKALKTLPDALKLRNQIIAAFEHASEHQAHENYNEVQKHLTFVIVGGGVTGTELAGQIADLLVKEMRALYNDVPHDKVKIILLHAGERLIEPFSEQASNAALNRLQDLNVDVRLNQKVTEVMGDGIKTDDGNTIPTNNVFWTAGTESQVAKIFPDELTNERGIIVTDKYRQVLNQPDIYALGDCATVQESEKEFGTPPTAQAAVWEAPYVAHNLVADIKGQAEKQIKPYKTKGDIVPIGDWFAIYQKDKTTFVGRLAWWLRRTVFLKSMFTWGKRLRVVSDWTIKITQPRDTSQF